MKKWGSGSIEVIPSQAAQILVRLFQEPVEPVNPHGWNWGKRRGYESVDFSVRETEFLLSSPNVTVQI